MGSILDRFHVEHEDIVGMTVDKQVAVTNK